ALEGIHKKSDLLFNINRLDEFAKNVNLELDDEVFWINFIAFESDGNFFKSTEIIKDVSNFHFSKLLKIFNDVNWEFREARFVDWDKVMTEYDYASKERLPRNLNFNSIFKIIPLRKDKEKKNKALELFKTILENRKVNKEVLYDYFVELILCHYYRRYGSYTNVQQYSQDYFSFAVRDSTFKYHAFIQFLKKLNLIDMEDPNSNSAEEKSENKYEKAIQDFFSKMSLNTDQKAMFYLGRMLNTVEYIQKGKTKTVIQKVNFNGMDREDIQRLRISLIEKAKQYNAIGKVIFTDNEFGKHFNFNNWALNPQEAVFFLLTGYSFGVGVKDAEELTEKETL
ncbi:MAG: TM1802 family CRISPR-associated protein, partial [Gillisia sp.]